MDPVTATGVTAAAAQFVGLALSVSTTLTQYWRAVKYAPKRSRELKQELLLVSDLLGDLKSVIETVPPDVLSTNVALKSSADEFGEVIKDMADCIEVHKVDFKKRLKWPFT